MYEALVYIFEKVNCNLIHISAGVERLENFLDLYDIISKLVKKEVFIVAAFANNGAVSYPASFDNVIGVDMSTNILKKNSTKQLKGASLIFYKYD